MKQVRNQRQKSSAKLTAEKVLAIRADSRPHKDIAREYGITPSNVGAVKQRKTWTHI